MTKKRINVWDHIGENIIFRGKNYIVVGVDLKGGLVYLTKYSVEGAFSGIDVYPLSAYLSAERVYKEQQ